MLYEGKTIRLKNGQEAILRGPQAEDAEEMIRYLIDCAGETEFILRYPEECPTDVEAEAAYLEGINRSGTGIMIVCFVEGEMAGNCQLKFGGTVKTCHRSTLAIGLRKKYWNLGIGTAMFEEMIRISKERGILQMELEYIEGNERARNLYEKMGFTEVARRPNAYRLKDGSLRSEVIMIHPME